MTLAAATAVCLLSAEPSSAFIAPAVVTSTRAGATASSRAPTMVAEAPSKAFVTTKSEETFAEAKVWWWRWCSAVLLWRRDGRAAALNSAHEHL